MQELDEHIAVRDEARAFEEALPDSQRKELGQFFTGMPLGRVLAHLAVDADTRYVLDPMAGTGDLLDSAHEAAASCEAAIERLDAIEVDIETAAVCDLRLNRICSADLVTPHVVFGDAFDPDTYKTFRKDGYGLVIANPPYVRYQSLNGRADKTRQGLLSIAEQRLTGVSKETWTELADAYSGLADLSIPAWLLSALLVKPGGRLALVVPATWRSRTYADVIRYLLLRCFSLETIVEDTQPGWFSDALVRTHLIMARRLADDDIAIPLGARTDWPAASWIQIAPEAASSLSLVGKSFDGDKPEAAFAKWCVSGDRQDRVGISARDFSLKDEWGSLRQRARSRGWLEALEGDAHDLPLFGGAQDTKTPVPESLKDLLPTNFSYDNLIPLEDAGIRTGQGLRTGCNRFFYVQYIGPADEGCSIVRTAPVLGGKDLVVPDNALTPVLHRQAELEAWIAGVIPQTRILDLRSWVLPEDCDNARAAEQAYRKAGESFPQIMPESLASFVRDAATKPLGGTDKSRTVSELSAVRTNVRQARDNAPPRFWYMLPEFMPRHLPQAFVPRIIHGAPVVYTNSEPPIVIDANFSTFWPVQRKWKSESLAAILNSVWCRAVMEAVGTPLGGGALKLEAVHIRRMPVPRLDDATIQKLDTTVRRTQGLRAEHAIDRIVLRALLPTTASDSDIDVLAQRLTVRLSEMGAARQRGAA